MTSAARPTGPAVAADGFQHLGLLYRDQKQYLAGAAGFVQSALAQDSPVLVAVPGQSLDLIREGLGADADLVECVDMAVAGRNPGGLLPSMLLAFARRHAGRRVSIIGEPVWPGRTQVEYPACVVHEALTNAAFAGRDAAVLCPYDELGLPRQAILDAHRTHPVMTDDTGNRWPSPYYTDPFLTVARHNEPLSAPPSEAATMTYRNPADLAEVRSFVRARAAKAGLPADRLGLLAVAVNELAANTIDHTSGPGTVRVWSDPTALICQVEDTGHLANPLAGRVPPAPDALGGRGLVLVNQSCDLVRAHSRPGRTAVRIYHYLTPHR